MKPNNKIKPITKCINILHNDKNNELGMLLNL